ncbi:MAG: glycogen-binding domain-containing protein [Candidatus Latescibacterota bacterium]
MPANTSRNSRKRVNFALHAPQARQVHLAGSFNDWNPTAKPLRPDKKGVWRTWLNLPPGQYEYLFVVDQEWRPDPGCTEHSQNPYGSHNCILRV